MNLDQTKDRAEAEYDLGSDPSLALKELLDPITKDKISTLKNRSTGANLDS